ncbi:glycosyltransferase family 9 protein [Derxia gummosa]|uniref:Glycosyltransferase family 9 protein n=1 Tax=Derxia gummosa DSM 723 TaxID=1121388 RepID=A0A8B6X3T9_9BURK|nr:glycosyltransferase family 9 protein [Derxia gummosa]
MRQLYCPPFGAQFANHLESAFHARPPAQRRRDRNKLLRRRLLEACLLRRALRRDTAPEGTRRVLWLYNWPSIGDSLTDLAARSLLPAHVELDLCIAPHLAPLYAGDRRFSAIWSDLRAIPATRRHDFILLQQSTTPALWQLSRRFPATRYASVLGDIVGDMFDRLHFGQLRLEQIFQLPSAARVAQLLPPPALPVRLDGEPAIAMAIGARDPRRHFRRWAEVARELRASLPGRPVFHLLGDDSAQAEAASLVAACPGLRFVNHVGRTRLENLRQIVHAADAFLGADGGLMHLALAYDKPGCALFANLPASYRVHPRARLGTVETDGPLDALCARTIARTYVASLGRTAQFLASSAYWMRCSPA